MRKLWFLIFLFAPMLQAQTSITVFVTTNASPSITLSWKPSAQSTTTTPGTVTVYRASGNCPASGIGSLTYTTLTTSAPAGGPYTDKTATPGTWCYYVTATISGLVSPPSTTAQAILVTSISAPTALIVSGN